MKKYLIIISILLAFTSNLNKEDKIVVIPDEAIRFRVVANDNSKTSQQTKLLIKDALEEKLNILLKNSQSINETKSILKSNYQTFDNTIKTTLLTNHLTETYHINYGLNYFPAKKYKGVVYEEGYYESLVITLGNGNGENWWCVLFPPLCLMDTETLPKDVEYKSFVQEMITKYLSSNKS